MQLHYSHVFHDIAMNILTRKRIYVKHFKSSLNFYRRHIKDIYAGACTHAENTFAVMLRILNSKGVFCKIKEYKKRVKRDFCL